MNFSSRLSLRGMSLISVFTHYFRKSASWIRQVLKQRVDRVLFLKEQEVCFAVADLVAAKFALMTAVKVVWNVVCTFGLPVIFLVLSELNWGQSRQRKSVCQWQRLYMTEQRLTSFLINHRNLTWKGFNRHTSFVIRNF